MEECVLAIDLSTSAVEVCVIAVNDREIKRRFAEPIGVLRPRENWFEFDPEEIWEKQERLLLEAREWAKDLEIVGIGITNQRETIVAWDKNTGRPLCNAISWQDNRNEAFVERFSAHAELIRERTGLVLGSYFSAAKMVWILENLECERENIRFGTMDSWLVHRLTKGKIHFTDVTNASRTMCMNLREEKWDPELLELFGIPLGSLPRIRPSGSCFGLWNDIPIWGVIGDQQAALLSLGGEPSSVQCTFGTGLFVLKNTGNEPLFFPGSVATVAWKIEGEPTVYALENGIFSCGSLLERLREEGYFRDYQVNRDILTNSICLEPLSGRIFLFNEGLREPLAKNLALREPMEAQSVLKSCLNGFALATKEIIDHFEEKSGKARIIRLGGQISGLEYLPKLQSLLLDRPVSTGNGELNSIRGIFYLVLLAKGKIGWDFPVDVGATFLDGKIYAPELTALHNLWFCTKCYL